MCKLKKSLPVRTIKSPKKVGSISRSKIKQAVKFVLENRKKCNKDRK